MKQTGIFLGLLFAFCRPALAAEVQPLLTTPGKMLVSEDFSGDAIPATFRSPTTPKSFRITDGALEAFYEPSQDRATHGVFDSKAHDLTVEFSLKFVKSGTLYIGVDGYKEEFKGNTHLVRFCLTPESMVWDEKRGGPESKHAVGEAMKAARAAKKPLPKATAEQLADPSFFRTVELTAKPIECAVGEWHKVVLEVSGNELVAQVDGQTLLATATVADAMKNRIGVGMVGRADIRIDNVRIYENTRRADWQEVKARLAADAAAKK